MPSLKLISKEAYKRATWKNGLGFTDEVAIYPPNASLAQGNFLWRLSSARIEKASPFSVFPNHDRVLVILKGEGMKLMHVYEEGEPAEVVDLPRLEPYEFPGDIQSKCELPDGSITDFSVFIKKAESEAQVEVRELEEGESFDWAPEGRWNFAFAIEGTFDYEGGELAEGNTLSLERTLSDTSPYSTIIYPKTAGSKLLLINLV